MILSENGRLKSTKIAITARKYIPAMGWNLDFHSSGNRGFKNYTPNAILHFTPG